MTDQIRDFDAEAPTEVMPPSGAFRLGGREWKVRNKDELPLGFRNLFADKDGVKIGPFFRATIHPTDIDEFMEMIEKPDGPLTQRNAGPVVDHVTGIVLDRPTQPAKSSSAGSKRSGGRSAAGSSSRATPRRKSA